jgi:hypothetical protein
MALGPLGVRRSTSTDSGTFIPSTQLTGRTETLVDPILSTIGDLLESPFGEPLPTTIHITSLVDRTVAILERIEDISRSREVPWEPIVVWEPYYVRLVEYSNADREADSIPANLDQMRELVPRVDIFRYVHPA